MTNIRNYVGIDISQDSFDYYFLSSQGTVMRGKSSYQDEDLLGFIPLLESNAHLVMEATGIYHLRLAVFLYERGFQVSVINPLVIKRYSQMSLCRSKTDRLDALLIYNYAITMHPESWIPESPYLARMQQLVACQRLLIKHRTAFNNHLLGLGKCPLVSQTSISILENQILTINQSIDQIQRELYQMIETYYTQEYDSMISIPGIGKKTAITLLTMVKGFDDFATAKQVCSYFGLYPRIYQSGSSVHPKIRICKMGMGYVRQLLYMCARSASKYNKVCKELYERLLAKGKPKKVALIAVANKLIKQVFAIVTKKQIYNENYVNKFAH
jgi:transposase